MHDGYTFGAQRASEIIQKLLVGDQNERQRPFNQPNGCLVQRVMMLNQLQGHLDSQLSGDSPCGREVV
ncbi:MAG: hypothetical protein CVU21_03905 [Betaproteobacteria bacterium HGW-Betaproteobacteria-15]|nr:MAG: hypothetical protein CVU21_03905 [Betaproteobacteria bacterium HGW-Betaproteobacteria-15]